MELPHNSVVLVVDGRKMLFLRNEGDAAYPNLVVEQAVEQENPATRDQATDSASPVLHHALAAHALLCCHLHLLATVFICSTIFDLTARWIDTFPPATVFIKVEPI